MRLCGICCICAAVVCFGVFRAGARRRSAQTLAGFASYFGSLAFAAGQTQGDTAQLLALCAGRAAEAFAFPRVLTELYARTGDLCAAWETALEESGAAQCLTAAQAGFLRSFGPVFASPSVAVFRESCGRYVSELQAYAEAALEKQRRAEKLGIPLSAMLAALLFVILV